MSPDFLLYGAYGYTGELIARLAAAQGLRPLLAGRDADKLRPLATELNLPFVALPLTDPAALDDALRGVAAVLHCAGPFSQTARPVAGACLRTGTHYLDITGEIDVFEWMATQDATAKRANVTLLPGVGFDVVPTDCLAAFLREQLPDATHLELAFAGASQVSRGTALTTVEGLTKTGKVRRNGALVDQPVGTHTREIVFEGTRQTVASIPWGDVSTAYRSTGIPNITVYIAATLATRVGMRLAHSFGWLLRTEGVQRWLKGQVRRRLVGPGEEHRTAGSTHLWGEVRNAAGRTVVARLQTPEAYQLTVLTALLATRRVLAGGVATGYQTPATAFGADFILAVSGTSREVSQ